MTMFEPDFLHPLAVARDIVDERRAEAERYRQAHQARAGYRARLLTVPRRTAPGPLVRLLDRPQATREAA